MHKYTNSRIDTAWGLGCAVALPAMLLLSACVNTPPPSDAATTPVAVEQAPSERPVVTPRVPLQVEQTPAAARIGLRDDAPLRYVVKKGDTLWDIAAYFLSDPFYWPELWYANPDIANPHLIYPGDILYLVYVDGRPQLRRSPGASDRLSPRVRELPIAQAIPTIPLDAIQQFLNGPRLVTQEELERAPYIIDFVDPHLVGGAGNQIYVGNAQPEAGSSYNLVRPGAPYIDPETGDILGYEGAPIGNVAISEFADISTGVLTRTFREALVADRLLPLDDEPLVSNFYPRAPEQAVQGQVISVYGGVSQIGQYQIVTLNRGKRQGLERGHVLDIYKTGRRARDPITERQVILPPLKAGTMMIFKVEDRVSFGLVMRATRAIHVLDGVSNPK